eukprot:UN20281
MKSGFWMVASIRFWGTFFTTNRLICDYKKQKMSAVKSLRGNLLEEKVETCFYEEILKGKFPTIR